MTELSRLLHNDIIGDAVDRVLENADALPSLEGRLMTAWMDGLLTAAIIGPVAIGIDELVQALPADLAGAETRLVAAMHAVLEIRHEQIRLEINDLKDEFEPNFLDEIESPEEELELAREWAAGFHMAMWIKPGSWTAINAADEAFANFSQIGILMLDPKDDLDQQQHDDQCRDAMLFIGEAVWAVRQFWRRQAPKKSQGRSLNKLGRNSPCPCGSGNKFKRCCMN